MVRISHPPNAWSNLICCLLKGFLWSRMRANLLFTLPFPPLYHHHRHVHAILLLVLQSIINGPEVIGDLMKIYSTIIIRLYTLTTSPHYRLSQFRQKITLCILLSFSFGFSWIFCLSVRLSARPLVYHCESSLFPNIFM